MKLDTTHLRYLSNEDWRVLTAVEMGSRNHEVVPTPLIAQISGMRGGSGVQRSISTLAKIGLIGKVKNAHYDGYRLTYGGVDYLALNTFSKRKTVYSVGNQIGVGKESDIYVVAGETGVQHVLKIHRLGRISFRSVKANRDYLRNRNSGSWMYMSRLAATKEFEFMKVLRENGFPVPEPLDQSRHCILMELIDAHPLRSVTEIVNPAKLYAELMELIVKFANHGLIHGDFNEFNILVYEKSQKPIVIDFPQMISVDHANAEEQFDRDVNCIKRFFERKFGFKSDQPGPFFTKDVNTTKRLDAEVMASGFSKKQWKELEKYRLQVLANEKDDEGEEGESAEQAVDENAEGDSEEEDDSEEEEEEEQLVQEEEEEEEEGEIIGTDKLGNAIYAKRGETTDKKASK
ncbi:RIO1-domain-containing protein [Ascobolus immersus RN42]|uniref:Serine/threonine-protein kinase RIO2 n=1 Tax=Ascobolus immersus RN42 TaxID=1160509 RepID=A0A3N4IAV9_ASCIM|nr:RIO1-domain-containing protein [Ascobolus immersus RN42]